MNDYERIALLIRCWEQSPSEPPDWAAWAECAGLSQSQLNRLFATWAGSTPEDFFHCLTLPHAQERLRKGKAAVDVTLDSGVSETSRLHGADVNLEAVSGEVKSGGEGWTINAGFADSPFGTCLLGDSPQGICHLSFVDAKDGSADWAALTADWPQAHVRRDDSMAKQHVDLIFQRAAQAHPLRVFVRGTAFQIRVWRALLQIRPGTLVSYGQLASALGNPAAARAVGTAVGRNPVSYLIPCHRVIRATGVVGDYRWGQVRKRALLAWESVGGA
jgi:AraC family transcriptional regulator of adaptative response/methylated-DNA-[protein]-cysteine methyltransferase